MRMVTVLIGLLAAGGAVVAQNIEFIEPAGTTVRGDVTVQVDLGAAYETGSVAFYIGPADETLEFNSATISDANGLFSFEWQTQGEQTRIADGEYRVLAIGYNAAGEVIGQKSITIEVQNDVPETQIPATGILLRYNLTPGRSSGYRGSSSINVQGGDGLGDDAFKELRVGGFGGVVAARWDERILWRNPDGKAQVRNSVYGHVEGRPMLGGRDMQAHGRFLSFLQEPLGQIIRREDLTPVEFPYAELNLEFPEEPVKVGDQWRSELRILVDPRSNYIDEVVATHTLTGVQWYAGARCAVIRSEFEGGPYRVTLAGVRVPESGGAGGAAGGPPGAMGPGAAGGAAGGGQPGPPEEQKWGTTILLRGVRTTYFAFQPEVGSILRVEENMEQHCAIESSGSGGAAGMAGPGMDVAPGIMGGAPIGPPGGMGGGGAPPILPGGGMPGLMPAGPPGSGSAAGSAAMGPGGMPGSGGMMPGMPGGSGMMPGMPGGGSSSMGPGMPGGSGGAAGSQKDEVKVGHFARTINTVIFQDAALREALRYDFN